MEKENVNAAGAIELIAKVSMGKDISGVVERITTALAPQKQSGRVR